MPTLHEQFEAKASQEPENIALIIGETKIEYGRLLEAIKRLAGGLAKLGIRKGDRVAVMLPNVPHFAVSYYGILELGAVAVPVNIMYSQKEIAYVLSDSGARAIIAWAGFKEHVLPAVSSCADCREIILLGERVPRHTWALTQLIANARPLEQPVEVSEEDLAVVNYTSGIADDPLGAEMTHKALATNAATCKDMYLITAEEKVLAALPLFHPLGQILLLHTPFLAGATVVLLPRFSVTNVLQAISQNGITFMAGVPGIYESMVREVDSPQENSLKYCLSYGGKLSEEVIQEFEEKFDALLLKSYGLTEAGPLVSANRVHRDRKPDAVGIPLIGTEVQIRNSEGEQALPNESGEIWVRSGSLMRGYFNRPEETRARLKDGWLFTGDIGYLDEDHYLFVQERKEDILEKDGFQIFPHEIEDVLKKHETVAEVAVVGIPDPTHGTEVKAYVVLKDGMEATSEELYLFCRAELPLYKCPKEIEFCSQLPKSPTGRVLKRLLRKGAASGRKRS